MNRKKILLVGLLVCIGAMAAVLLRPVDIDYGTSEMYTRKEVEAAAQTVVDQVNSWEGCRLYSVAYEGDLRCKMELDYCLGLGEGKDCEECIVFTGSFRSPLFNSGSWNPNHVYHWTWYLGRPKGGTWEILTWGVP